MNTPRATPKREDALQPLLLAILTRMRRFRDTPLRFGIDVQSIAHAAWEEFLLNLSEEEKGRWQNQAAAVDALNNQVSRLLSQAPPNAGPQDQTLADWIERLYRTLRESDDRAIELIELRAEEWQPRDIAEHLDLGLRLVKRILHHMEVNWNQASTPA